MNTSYNSPPNNTNIFSSLNKFAIILLIVLLCVLFLYLALYSVYYMFVPCDTEKKFDLNIFNICKEQKYPEASQSIVQREIEREKEVFHIDNQNLTYEQAKKKCEAYDSVLATKEQIISAYNKGANWCTYGWTEGNQAYYPVQECIDNKNCGKPGINGGYFVGKNIKFGANCYGIKPVNKNIVPDSLYCKETPFCEKESNRQSCVRDPSDFISPFNKDRWSMYKL